MTKIELYCDGASARQHTDGQITEGAVGIEVELFLNSDWDGLGKFVVFKTALEARKAVEIQNIAVVPWEILKAGLNLYIGVIGKSADGKVVIPTIWADCGIIKPSPMGIEAEDAEPEPTPGVVDQILAKAENAQTVAEEAREAALTGQESAAASAEAARIAAEKTAVDLETLIEIEETGIRVPTLEAHELLARRVEELNNKPVSPEAYDDTEMKREQKEIKDSLSHKVGFSEVSGNQLLMYADATKKTLLAALDLPQTDLTDYVKNTDYAASQKAGVVKVGSVNQSGLSVNSGGILAVEACANSQIDSRSTGVRPITPANLVRAVDSVICSTSSNEQLTAQQQLSARQRLGIDDDYSLVADITLEDTTAAVIVNLPETTRHVVIQYSCTATGNGNGGCLLTFADGTTLNYCPTISSMMATSLRHGYATIDLDGNFAKAQSSSMFTDPAGWQIAAMQSNLNSCKIVGNVGGIRSLRLASLNNYAYLAGSRFYVYAR